MFEKLDQNQVYCENDEFTVELLEPLSLSLNVLCCCWFLGAMSSWLVPRAGMLAGTLTGSLAGTQAGTLAGILAGMLAGTLAGTLVLQAGPSGWSFRLVLQAGMLAGTLVLQAGPSGWNTSWNAGWNTGASGWSFRLEHWLER